jgi:hypothetical protein
MSVCLSQVPGAAAAAIDTTLDDGVGNTGSVVATPNAGAAAGVNSAANVAGAANYNEQNYYTVCKLL